MFDSSIYLNQNLQYPQVQQDYRYVKKHVDKVDDTDKSLFYALESLPPVRRLTSLPEKIQNGDAIPALGLAGLALINIKEDMRDIRSAGSQIRGIFDKKHTHIDPYNRATHQHSFSFFKGTLIEEWLHKKIDSGNKFAQKLYEMDKNTVYETKFGEKIQKFLGIEQLDNVQKIDTITDFKGKAARAYQFKSAKFGGEITARAMKRLPLLSVVAVGLLEIPKIFKATTKGDSIGENITSTAKQTASSGLNATSTLAGIGYGGALGAKHGGATGSIVGMGLGAILGANASKKLQDIIA